ncbi:hypothetical protein N9L19_00315 [bacterium]|nr:hypothetical protein [bacterium]
MLEVVVSDFERAAKVNLKSEKKALKELFKFERISNISVVSKKTPRSTAKFDLKDPETNIIEPTDDLEIHPGMIYVAFKTLEDLKPVAWTLACPTRTVLGTTSTISTRSRRRSADLIPMVAPHSQGLWP